MSVSLFLPLLFRNYFMA